ncbi:MAG: protein-disulfide reductase DsbD [Planctomycetota bacterium]
MSIAGIAAAAEFELGAGRPAEPKPVISAGAKIVPSGGTFDIIADFKLDKTVHLYKDKLGIKWTKLKGASYSKLVLPKPETIDDPLSDKPGATIDVYTGDVKIIGRLTAAAKPGEQIILEGKFLHQSCTDKICFPPAEEPFAFKLVATEAEAPDNAAASASATAGVEAAADSEYVGKTLFGILVMAFFGGILLGLTPCVYPMIPVTAAVIGARKEKGLASAIRASLVYVLGLATAYSLLGLLVAKLGSVVSTFLQSPYVLVPVAGVFVALAVVMFAGLNFGAPTGFAAKVQGMLAGKKGLAATFALGAVSGIVAGPCIAAPLAGVLAYIAKTGNLTLGFWMLFVLAWGMGMPLILFGTATGIMPKAGPWMEWTKKLLGFVLLWAAIFFLKTVIGDMAYQLGFGALLIAAAIFLGGFDVLARESAFGGRLKRLFGVIAVLCALALVAPPAAKLAGISTSGPAPQPPANVFTRGAQNDVEVAIAAGKPVVLDFYADWCTICKDLDRKVYTKPEVAEAAKGLTMLKIDVDKDPQLAKKYGVFRPPVAVFIGAGGKVRKDLSFVGPKSLDEFVKLLQEFKK